VPLAGINWLTGLRAPIGRIALIRYLLQAIVVIFVFLWIWPEL
jgi:uncharacterized membrane protein YeiB